MFSGALEAAMQAPSNSSSQLSWSAWTLARMISCMTLFIRSVCPSACGVYAGVNFKAVLCRAHSLRQKSFTNLPSLSLVRDSMAPR
jgi:hypothetical protein